MVAASFHAGEVEAQNAFNRQVARAQNTSMFKYNRISGISQDTANAYIANGIEKAKQTSISYGCSTPTVSNESLDRFVANVNNSKIDANTRIENIKESKKNSYIAYHEYQKRKKNNRTKDDLVTTYCSFPEDSYVSSDDHDKELLGMAALEKVTITTIEEQFDLSFGLDLIKVSHTQTVTTSVVKSGTEGDLFGGYIYSDSVFDINSIYEGTDYGVGINLLYVLGFDVNVKWFGIGATLSLKISNVSLYINMEINLAGDAQASIGIVNELRNGDEINDRLAIKGNTAAILSIIVVLIYGVQTNTGGAPQTSPVPVPAY